MKLHVFRISSSENSTLGILFEETSQDYPPDFVGAKPEPKYRFMCFTIEDEYRTEKVYGKTRIPAGTYEIILKNFGKFHNRYSRPGHWANDIHEGMLHILGVPGFTDVLIHTGNTDGDTAGCLLVGDSAFQNITEDGAIGNSRAAYRRIYPYIINEDTPKITIEYHDFA